MVITSRLRLVPATCELARAGLADSVAFAQHLGAAVPANWSPAILADARAFFLELLEAHPGWSGWLGWYAVATSPGAPAVLIGSAGFYGPPGRDGIAEIGYSVLPQFQGRGYATEMVAALIGWAGDSGQVQAIVAQTAADNVGSQRELVRAGFVAVGPGQGAGCTLPAVVSPATRPLTRR